LSTFHVAPTAGYERDLERLEDFLVERELRSEFPDATVPARFVTAVDRGLDILTFSPHTCRRCETAPQWRELVVPFGQTGFVVLFEIREEQVLLLAMRTQREEDYR
jgi:hypothetical protein